MISSIKRRAQSAKQPKIYFLHIPKTAGTTTTHYLNAHYAQPHAFPNELWSDLLVRMAPYIKSSHRLIRGHFGASILPLLDDSWSVITMLREPSERTVSQFYHIEFDPNGNKWVKPGFLQNKSLDDALADKDIRAFFDNYQSRYLSVEIPVDTLKKQPKPVFYDSLVDFVHPKLSDQQIEHKANELLADMAFVGFQDLFQESLLLLGSIANWGPKVDHERLASVSGRPPMAEISDKARSSLKEINKIDHKIYSEQRRKFLSKYINLLNSNLSQSISEDEFLERRSFYNRKLIDSAAENSWRKIDDK